MKSILIAGVIAVLGTLLGTRLAVGYMVKKGYGQFIRDDGPTSHHAKRGTPTMGGIVIIASVALAYFIAHFVSGTKPTASALLVLWLFVGLGVIGFLDDFTKLRKERSLGLNSRAKMLGQFLVGLSFALASLLVADSRGVHVASQHISFLRDLPWTNMALFGIPAVGLILASAWIIVLVTGASNAVNLTDGLDGLATGASTMVFGAYGLINIWQFNQWCARTATSGPRCYEVRDPLDLAVLAIAIAGACFGFLWWNAKPAKIYLGDTGSLALGGALAGFAICTRTEVLLVLLGGLFVVETLSVMLQVGWFKFSSGKRLFKMAPIHHHFELLGWNEVTVVIRFWIIAGLCVAAALGIFYAEWVVGQ
ncbi:MAG: phospho-N-acetylmuramoyl-pentapeptide-transferase [Propionibacteriaceae bacterium]